MSDHTQEEKMPKLKKRCFLCNDVLFDVFTLVSNKAILGTRLAFVNGQFDTIVDKLLLRKSRKWLLGILELRCAEQQQGEGKVPQIYKDIPPDLTQCVPPYTGYALFYVATTPATYIIGLLYNRYNGDTFMVENKRTNERLTLRHYMPGYYITGGWCVLTRGPLDWEEKRWAPWEFASVDFCSVSSSYVKIRLSDYNASGLSAEEDDEN
ncbi:hypothetical protein niasHT_031042 [Heterodera trifolii]|uniref:Uncharacterized protein n=1 Tax=Heterodera trifolii TaxID=157864 RepID=A0ABD2HYL3_9BILA